MRWISAHFEDVLTFFFKTYKPQYLDKVPEFITEFEGQELRCIELLCSRYFVDFEKFVSKAKIALNITPEQIAAAEEAFRETDTPVNNENTEIVVEDTEEAPKKKSKLWLVILLVVVLGGGAAYYLLFMRGDNVTEETPMETKKDNIEQVEIESPIEETLIDTTSIDSSTMTTDSLEATNDSLLTDSLINDSL